MRVRPLEIKALVPLLEQDWETPQELAEALIRTIDEVRASRTSYVWVAQFGPPKMAGMVWYAGAGPYPGRKSAERAAKGYPGAELASALAVVPILTSEGLERQIEKTDKPRETV
jgi:hypothetical protein